VKQTGWDFISRKINGFDITTSEFNFVGYDVIVNCIAYTDTYSDNKDLHWNVNYKSVSDLVDYCNVNNMKLVHISTDYVYTNSDSNVSETDIPIHGNNWYSYTKLLADAYIQLKSNNYLICRCTHKQTPFPYESAWINQIGNFDYVDVITSLIINLILSDNFGIFNVGTELKSMFELAKRTNPMILPILKPAYVPTNTTMDTYKLKKIYK
jgi:hypothetical protein